MELAVIAVLYYQTESGGCPFGKWLDSLDAGTQAVMVGRLARIRRGLFGDSEHLGGGVFELKFDIGPGYRIYYGKDGRAVVLLLQAGHKKGQSADIRAARECWKDYLRRTGR